MKEKRRFSMHFGIGVASIMVVFIVLCLVTFSVLSYLSARADASLTDELATRTTAYYNACNEAENKLDQLDAQLTDYYKSAESEQAFFALCTTDTQSFEITINDSQALQVTVQYLYPETAEGPYYRITQWQTVSTTAWEPDNSLNLMEG